MTRWRMYGQDRGTVHQYGIVECDSWLEAMERARQLAGAECVGVCREGVRTPNAKRRLEMTDPFPKWDEYRRRNADKVRAGIAEYHERKRKGQTR